MQNAEYCDRYARKENFSNSAAEDESGEDDISNGECTSSDDEIAGHADPWKNNHGFRLGYYTSDTTYISLCLVTTNLHLV